MSLSSPSPRDRQLTWYVRVAPAARKLERLAWHVVWFALVFMVLSFN